MAHREPLQALNLFTWVFWRNPWEFQWSNDSGPKEGEDNYEFQRNPLEL